jgi:acyl transferase domain-containing protein/2-polyprenyl-3-methyl-5-hydroxy-6-metoxy-1,4-benzoquinol methylase
VISTQKIKADSRQIPTRLERWDDTALRRISINNYGYGGTISHIILDSLSTYHKEISAAEGPSHEKTINHVNSCGVGVQRNGVEKAIGSSANNYLVDDIMSKLIADIIPTRSVSQSIETYEQSSECQATFPQLLVLTAKSESSLAKSVENLKQWISQKSDLGVDGFRNLAYTLSSRRSFFLWRYTLTGTSLKDVLSVLSSKRSNPTKSETKNKIVFVFTGQGAQWFAMGRELMRFNSAYLASLQASDRILTDFGASWSLEAELLKESSHSRVYESQIAQPATTALQIALVDLLSCIDILPNFVIGHSSGEIAAAYAAGSLDRYSAMKVAYYRGLLRVSSLLKGAMLAVGLCEKSVSHYISQVRDGELVVACSNSPESSTVSGDEAAILELKEILDAKSIFSRRLAVDTAYHSHHIRSVAEEYLHNLDGLEHDVVSPSVRFISSVTGKEMTSGFGPHYWVANLVSKVQFQSVLEELCRKTSSTTTQGRLTFLEVGPHGALSGPIRQTLASLKLSAGYLNISVLIRKQDARYTLLEAVGKLFEQGHSVNLEAANLLFESDPQRRLISDFPTYPWDHSTTHWCESRLSKAHRFRKHPYHDLLGTRIPSSTNLNPIWRHVISVDQLPWVREHIIDGFMIFPASGYISMAIEAMHQWNSEKYESQVINISSYILKNIRIPSALMVQDSPARVELQLSLNTNRSQQDNSKSKWDEFRVSSISANGSSIEHCHGLIMARLSAEVDDVEAAREKELNGSAQIAHLDALEAVCNEKLNCMELYRDLRSRGNGYGPNFACNKELSLDKTSGFGILSIPDVSQCMPMQIQQPHIIHPATLDALMHQALAIFNRYTQDNTFMVVGIDELKISSNIANEPGTILKLATTTTGSGSKFPSADTMAFQKNSNLDMEGVIEINNAKFRATGGGIKTDVDANSERNMSYSMIWDLDADFMTSTMLTPDSHALEPGPSSEHASGLLNQAAAIYIERCVKRLMVNSPTKLPERFHHLFKRIFELQQSIEFSNLLKSVLDSEVESLLEKTYSLGEEGRLLQQLGSQLESILNGKIDALSSIKGDDVICRLCLGYIPSRCHTHLTEYIKKLVFKDPNMRVIELGAGVGGTTASLLHTLDSDGALPFKEYIITDVSSGFLERSRSRFQKWDSYIRYKKLDFTSDISKQDFEKESFDLIIAGNCFHAAPNLDDVISHIRKLLKPGGRLVMIENTHLLPFYKVLIGLLNDWEAGMRFLIRSDCFAFRTNTLCFSRNRRRSNR